MSSGVPKLVKAEKKLSTLPSAARRRSASIGKPVGSTLPQGVSLGRKSSSKARRRGRCSASRLARDQSSPHNSASFTHSPRRPPGPSVARSRFSGPASICSPGKPSRCSRRRSPALAMTRLYSPSSTSAGVGSWATSNWVSAARTGAISGASSGRSAWAGA